MLPRHHDPVIAITTAPGRGAVGIVRLSGRDLKPLVAALFQTWLNPTPPDPVQAKMMWIMPLVFSVMFFVFPAGLVLYWLTNNLLSIAQQYVINKKLGVLGK